MYLDVNDLVRVDWQAPGLPFVLQAVLDLPGCFLPPDRSGTFERYTTALVQLCKPPQNRRSSPSQR